MFVEDEALKCVVFVGYHANEQTHIIGTGWLVGVSGTSRQAIVTARHVIDQARARADDNTIRIWMNHRLGPRVEIAVEQDLWISHADPVVDLAAIAGIPDLSLLDHMIIDSGSIMTAESKARWSIGLGDEVAMVGLFFHHAGSTHNEPIVRIGNIAAMPNDPVATGLGSGEAWLVECRSTGGISGAPVIVNLGPFRPAASEPGQPPFWMLFGCVHGHWDEPGADSAAGRVNVGIALVTPSHRVLELLEQLAGAPVPTQWRMTAPARR